MSGFGNSGGFGQPPVGGGPFGGASSFGGQPTQQGPFGGNTMPTGNPFGTSPNVVAPSTTFGGGGQQFPQQQQQPSMQFGMAPTVSTPTQANSGFGGTPFGTATATSFGTSNTATFAPSSTSTFNNGSGFAASTPQNQSNLPGFAASATTTFGTSSNTTSSPFGAAPSAPSVPFNAAPSAFSGTPATNSGFASSPTSAMTNNPFGGGGGSTTTATPTVAFGTSSNVVGGTGISSGGGGGTGSNPFGQQAGISGAPSPFGGPSASTPQAQPFAMSASHGMRSPSNQGMNDGNDHRKKKKQPRSDLPFGKPPEKGPSSDPFGRSGTTTDGAPPFGNRRAKGGTASSPFGGGDQSLERASGPSTEEAKLAELRAKIEEKKRKLLEQKKRKVKESAARSRSTTPEPDPSSLAQRNALRFATSSNEATRTHLPADLKGRQQEATRSTTTSFVPGASSSNRETLADAVALVGTCQWMCPDEELIRRERESDIQMLELPRPGQLHPEGWSLRDTVVKRFRRSAADYKLDVPEWVRPPDVLEKVCGYLEEWVMERDRQGPDPRFPNNGTPPPLDIYQFIWDRTRMVRKDFILQNYVGTGGKCDARAVRCHERIARWHAMCEHQLSHIPDFVTMQSQQNIQELGQTMKTLNQYYDDSLNRSLVEEADDQGNEIRTDLGSINHGCSNEVVQGKNPIDYDGTPLKNEVGSDDLTGRIIGKHAVSRPSHGTAEPEMRGLYILLTIDNDGGMEVLKYAARLYRHRPEVYHSKPVQLALDIFKVKREFNYAKFFSILRSPRTPYLYCCIMFKHVEVMRKTAFRIMSKTYGGRSKEKNEAIYDAYPLKSLVRLLCFESLDEAKAACKHYNITVKPTKIRTSSGSSMEDVVFWRQSSFQEPSDPDKGTVIRLPPQKMLRTIENKLQGATKLAVCRGQVSGDGAFLSAAMLAASAQKTDPRENQQRMVELRAAALEEQKQSEEDERRKSAARELDRQKEEEKRAEMVRKEAIEVAKREREEAKVKQEAALQEKREKAIQEQRAKEEEERLRRIKMQEEEEKKRIELQRQAEQRKVEEERRKQREIEEQEAARRREEERKRLEEEERKRKEEQERQRLLEEERLRKEAEKRERERIAEEKRRREEEERERRAKMLLREQERALDESWSEKIDEARKRLIWGMWRMKVPRHVAMYGSTKTALRQLDRTDPVLDGLSPLLVPRGNEVKVVPGDLRRVIESLLTEERKINFAQRMADCLKAAKTKALPKRKTVLLSIAVMVPSVREARQQTFCDLALDWITSRLSLNYVSTFRSGDCEFRVCFVDESAKSRSTAVFDAVLVVVPPCQDRGSESEQFQAVEETLGGIDPSIPAAVLSLASYSADHSHWENRTFDMLRSSVASFQTARLLRNSCLNEESVEETLEAACDFLSESLVDRRTRLPILVEKISITRLGLLLVSDVMWLASVKLERRDDLLKDAHTALYCLADVLDKIGSEVGTLPNWPSRVFATWDETVPNYFSDGTELPIGWSSTFERDNVEPELKDLLTLLSGPFPDVIDNLLFGCPDYILASNKRLLEKRLFRQCLHHAIRWRIQNVYLEDGEPCIYFPVTLMPQIFELTRTSFREKTGYISPTTRQPLAVVEDDIEEESFSETIEPPPVEESLKSPGFICDTPMTREPLPVETPAMVPGILNENKRPRDEVPAGIWFSESGEEAGRIDSALANKRARPGLVDRKKHSSKEYKASDEFTRELERLVAGGTHDMFVGDSGNTLSSLLFDVPNLSDKDAASSLPSRR